MLYFIWNGGLTKKAGNRKPELMEHRQFTNFATAEKYAKATYEFGWAEADTVLSRISIEHSRKLNAK